MNLGQKVVRVSVHGNEGKIGDRGYIERVFKDNEGQAYGYNVVWESSPRSSQYVLPVRLATPEDWTREQERRKHIDNAQEPFV